jgi:hypothetical protein
MKRSMNRRGQAAIEASVMAFFLMSVFILVFYTFMMAVSKMRALDASFYAGRSLQVKKNWGMKDALFILGSTFGLKGILQNPSPGAVALRYLSPSPFRGWGMTQTSNAYVVPNFSFLDKSWPDAPPDPGASPSDFLKDAAAVALLLKAPAADSITDLVEEKEADGEVSLQ